jgi:hypothetical protein
MNKIKCEICGWWTGEINNSGSWGDRYGCICPYWLKQNRVTKGWWRVPFDSNECDKYYIKRNGGSYVVTPIISKRNGGDHSV